MKTKQQIKDEIKEAEKIIESYRKMFKNKEITHDVLHIEITVCHATIDALKWVLGENDNEGGIA